MWNFLKKVSPKMMVRKRLQLVAVDNNSIVGFITARVGKQVAHIGRLFVSIHSMRKGIGTKLLKKMETILKKKGIKKILLYSTISPYTVKFYEKNGYNNLGKKQVKMRGIKVVVFKMEKKL